jgi:hypothetical protein
MEQEDFHPGRPRARNSQPIANASRFSTGISHHFQLNNVESGKVVAGLGYFPSTLTLAFVSLKIF